MKFNKFGIVQGRLTKSRAGILQSFPGKKWINEFNLAGKLGFDFIELISERVKNNNNPIWSRKGRKKIKFLSKKKWTSNLFFV